VLALVLAVALAGCGGGGGPTEVVLVTHDSFAISDEVKKAFEDESGLTLRILQAGDAGEVVTKALLTAGNPEGDVLFGVDNNLLSRALEGEVFDGYESPGLASVDELWFVFYGRVAEILKAHGIPLSGWEEVAVRKTRRDGRPMLIPNPGFADRGFRAYVWNNVPGGGAEDLAYRLANGGYKVVLCPVSNLYFDLAWNRPSSSWRASS
jgi:hypothetical protein